MDGQRIEDMLEGPYRGEWLSIKAEHQGKLTKLEIATPEGIKVVNGKLQLLTYPFQVLLSDISKANVTTLQKPDVKHEYHLATHGIYGLDVRKHPWYSKGPINTIRAYFTAGEHAIRSITIDNRIAFQNPLVEERYGPLEVKSQYALREKLKFPIPEAI
mgnify:FL=1